MASSANALQAAIFACLTEDTVLTGMIGTGAVFDRRQTSKQMPYLVHSELTTSDFGPDAEEHLLTIETWVRCRGQEAGAGYRGACKRTCWMVLRWL